MTTGTLDLSLEHRQVVAFMGAYLSEYGCLPAVTEVAQGCGFGSSRPADRLMRELESYGVICRDGRYSRLGTLTVLGPNLLPDLSAQLFMTELARTENGAFLALVRRGLDLSPDMSHVAGLHFEGMKRATLIRSYDAVSQHLLKTGADLTAEDRSALRDYDGILAELESLCTDWDALCLCRLVWNLSAYQWVRGVEPLGLGYVGSSLVATMRTMAALIPLYRTEAAHAVATDPRRDHLFARLAVLLQRFQRGMARRISFAPEQLSVDVGGLLVMDDDRPRRLRPPRLSCRPGPARPRAVHTIDTVVAMRDRYVLRYVLDGLESSRRPGDGRPGDRYRTVSPRGGRRAGLRGRRGGSRL